MKPLIYLLLCFAGGSIPFGLLLGRIVRKIDLREHGSGNPGATNAFRILGPGWGMTALLADIGKGWIAVALLPGWLGLAGVGQGALWPLGGAVVAVLGHLFMPWLGFRGGKGVATAMGAFVGLAPWAALISAGAFLIIVALTRYVSLGSLALSVSFPPAAYFLGPPAPLQAGVVLLGAVLVLLIAWRHRANWQRIANGTEGRFSWRRR